MGEEEEEQPPPEADPEARVWSELGWGEVFWEFPKTRRTLF